MAIGAFRLPIMAGSGGGAEVLYNVDTFLTAGDWTKPEYHDYTIALLVGGAGGGTAGRKGAPGTNRGGGLAYGGQIVILVLRTDELNSTEAVVVGMGGIGGLSQTIDSTNGANGAIGGTTSFKGYSVVGGSRAGGTVNIAAPGNTPGFSIPPGTSHRRVLKRYVQPNTLIGSMGISDLMRGFGDIYLQQPSSCLGGSITLAGVYVQPKNPGIYNDAGVLINENTQTPAIGAPGVGAPHLFTYGDLLSRIFPWFKAADAPYLMGTPGGSGGSGDDAGTIPGGNGSDGLGFGGAGGGGGASTNPANSGAGGNGSQGIALFINVLKQ